VTGLSCAKADKAKQTSNTLERIGFEIFIVEFDMPSWFRKNAELLNH
jgi:hypothetical protein